MLLWLALLSCMTPADREWPELVPGPPNAGAAEGTLDLPVGTPLGGFTSRSLGQTSKQDNRASPYSRGFVESTGVQTRPTIKTLWLDNGDQHLVLIKVDVIYSNDKLVAHVSKALEETTGVPLEGKVVITANHTHSSYGPFADQLHFTLGGDRYNEEIFRRFVDEVVEVALDAHEQRQPAAIGAGWARDWDPEDQVYRDRRSENRELEVWPDQDRSYGKDPYLHVLRVDDLEGKPIALTYTFGIHGIALGEQNSMISGDAPLHTELVLQESFDEPVVVMHLQGGAGDASPAGRDSGYARMEAVGELAVDGVLGLWDQVTTASDPITLETASRHIWQHHSQIRVQRDGKVDWYYAPYEEGRPPNNQIYDDEGEILSPIDEFNVPYGAAFCGGEALIPAGDIGADVFPYDSCTDVEVLINVISALFDIPEEERTLPLPESMKAGTTATRLGPIPTQTPEGDEVSQDLFAGFFPAEPTAMFTEQWRRRVHAELGHEMPLLVGFAQDHEGYFLIPEDWLLGGYEPNINIWGPLQAEHVMEGVLSYSDQILSDNTVRQDPDPLGFYAPTAYPEREIEHHRPDATPNAGTPVTEAPEYLWRPLDLELQLQTPAEVRRVQDQVQLAWMGGDPAVDNPRVVLERLEDGDWIEVRSHAGRPITDAMPDILVGHTPDPLYPHSADQVHRWWAGWQAVGHVHDRAGLPLGTYRLSVAGHRFSGEEDHWPFSTDTYLLEGEPFDLVPAQVSIQVEDGNALWAAIEGPSDGWRLIELEGGSKGANPLRGPVEVVIEGDTHLEVTVEPDEVDGGWSHLPVSLPDGASSIVVQDVYGNTGQLDL